jgi:hypothetical protein
MADATVKYQTEVKVQHRIKSDTIKYCERELRKEELQAEKKSIELIRDYQSLKKRQYRYMESLEDKAGEIDDYEKKMVKAVEDLEEELMNIEMVLQDALQIATDKFKEKVTFIINDIKAKTINFCSSLKEAFD